MAKAAKSDLSFSPPFWILTIFLILVFATGGASRANVESLVVLRPASVLVCGLALFWLGRDHIRSYKFLFIVAAALLGLVMLHLIPLPSAIWSALPGRDIVIATEKAAGMATVWRPISLAPPTTWNAFFSLFTPLALLLLGVQLNRHEHIRVLMLVIGLGFFSGMIGILQSIGNPNGPLYFYEITNNGSAVGLFSNRNHQAVLLATLFPMLAVFACENIRTTEQAAIRGWLAVAGGVVLIPLILVTGSRAGLLAGAIGMAFAALLYKRPSISIPAKRKGGRIDLRMLGFAIGAVLMVGLTILFSRALAIDRLSQASEGEDSRSKFWPQIVDMIPDYSWIGSGIGSFAEAYAIKEPLHLLDQTYLNHAHNDWLEAVVTGGLPAALLILAAVIGFLLAAKKAFSRTPNGERSNALRKLGAAIILIFGITSIADYPLRAPISAAIFVLAAIWLSGTKPRNRDNKVGAVNSN